MATKPGDVLKLSLTELALRRVVVNLWNESDTLSAIAKFWFKSMRYIASRNAFLEAFEVEVKIKLSKLVVPESLKRQMSDLVRPIGSEIRAWKRYHEKYISDSPEEILKKLYWTSLGSIDFRKTAEEIVRCEVGDLVNRYNLACLYCLEEYIPSIWEELPGEIKNTFYNKGDTSHVKYPYLPYFWPYILKGEISDLDNMPGRRMSGDWSSFNIFVFCISARAGNKAAAEYFFNKLNRVEREESLISTCQNIALLRNLEQFEDSDDSPMEKHTEVLCYLLSLMTPEQRIECLAEHTLKFFRCFLDWPWYDIFSEISSLIWNFIPVEEYENLLWYMKLASIRSDYFIPKLFQEFFIHSPVNFKKHFLHQSCHFDHFLCILFDNEGSETIQVIFGNVDVDERMKLVNSYKFYNIFDDLITVDSWHFVELCLREATLSKENKETLKKTYMDFLIEEDKPIKPKEWKRFFQILDKIDASVPNKRSSEDETPTETKILRSGNKRNSR